MTATGYLPERKKPVEFVSAGGAKAAAIYQRLLQLGDQLMALIRRSRGRDNKSLGAFAEEIRKLIEKFEF